MEKVDDKELEALFSLNNSIQELFNLAMWAKAPDALRLKTEIDTHLKELIKLLKEEEVNQ